MSLPEVIGPIPCPGCAYPESSFFRQPMQHTKLRDWLCIRCSFIALDGAVQRVEQALAQVSETYNAEWLDPIKRRHTRWALWYAATGDRAWLMKVDYDIQRGLYRDTRCLKWGNVTLPPQYRCALPEHHEGPHEFEKETV